MNNETEFPVYEDGQKIIYKTATKTGGKHNGIKWSAWKTGTLRVLKDPTGSLVAYSVDEEDAPEFHPKLELQYTDEVTTCHYYADDIDLLAFRLDTSKDKKPDTYALSEAEVKVAKTKFGYFYAGHPNAEQMMKDPQYRKEQLRMLVPTNEQP